MKKSLIIFLISLVLIMPFVLAQEESSSQIDPSSNLSNTFKEEFQKQRDATNPWTQKTPLPESLQGLTKFLFNLSNEEKYSSPSVEDAVVFVMVLFMFFLIIYQALGFTGIIKEGIVATLTAIAISLLASIFGGMTYLATTYIAFTEAIGKVSQMGIIDGSGWGMFLFYIPLLILIIAIWFIFDLIRTWVHKSSVKTAADVKAIGIKNALNQIREMSKEGLS